MTEREVTQRAAALYAEDLTSQSLGITVEAVGVGTARTRMRIAESMVNAHGIAHGGYLFLFADTAFAYACNSYGPVTVAHSAQVTFVRPVFTGDELVAEATERTRYGRNGVYDVTVRRVGTATRHDTSGGGEIVAEFRGQSMMLSGTPGPTPAPSRTADPAAGAGPGTPGEPVRASGPARPGGVEE